MAANMIKDSPPFIIIISTSDKTKLVYSNNGNIMLPIVTNGVNEKKLIEKNYL